MLLKGVIPMPPAMKTSFCLGSGGSVKSPATWPAIIVVRPSILDKAFLKLLLPANGGPRGGNPLICDRKDFHIFVAVERVTDTNAPEVATFRSRYLDVTASIDVEIGKSTLQWHLGEERWREAHQGGQKKTAATSDEREGSQRPAPGWRWSETPSSPAAGCRCDCGWSDERARRPRASARPRDGR